LNLYLIGYRATGKSTVGRNLARTLGLVFADCDEEFVRDQGCSIDALVAARGWSAFRAVEKEILGRIAAKSGQVVASGGGAVLDADNRAVMQNSGVVVWLQAAWQTIHERMATDRHTTANRPPLSDQELADEIRITLAARGPLYADIADFSVVTDTVPITEVVDLIQVCLQELPKAAVLIAGTSSET